MHPLLQAWPKYLTEFIGTMFLVLIIGLSLGSGSPFFALSVGLGLAALAYMGISISGAHYNPAVSLAMAINRKISWAMGGIYVLIQLAGATAGAGLTKLLVQDDAFTFMIAPAGSASTAEILLAEILFTFLLVLVISFVAVSQTYKENSHYGLAMGFTVFAGIISVGDISGAALNPAVAFGPDILQLAWVPLWYYWVGPLIGGTLAALVFRVLSPNDIPPPTRKVKAVAAEVLEELNEEEAPEEHVLEPAEEADEYQAD